MAIQKKRDGLDKLQLKKRNESLENLCKYFDNQYTWKSYAELRRDLPRSPNAIQRDIEILKKIGYIVEEFPVRKSKKKRRGLFAASQNLEMIHYYEEVQKRNKQEKLGRTKLSHNVVMGMIRLSETTMSKDQVAKLFGLKSGKSFEQLVRKYPSFYQFREQLRTMNENKLGIVVGIAELPPKEILERPIFVSIER